jgi:hydrophobe/amphiphile efflux-1 (HAE1) family protein
MTLSDLSIRRPVFAWMLMFGLIVFGLISFFRLGVSQLPDVDHPVLQMNITWEGAAPEVMESEIVDRLEQAVISVQGIRDITSRIRQGQATITLEFDLNRDVDVALQEVQANISRVRLPVDVEPPVILKSNPDDQPIMWLGVSSERSLRDLIVYIDENLRDQFQILPGVGEIQLGGFSERNLRLWVDNDKLRQYELTITDVQRAVGVEQIESAAGYMENQQQEFNLRVMGEGRTADEVANLLITQRGGRPIYRSNIRVKDVARVEDGLSDFRRISRINGVPGVGLGIKKQRGANAVEVAETVRAKIAELEKTLPKDIHVNVNFDSTVFIEEAVSETEFTLILSALVTGLVCWFFLGSWSSTFNVLLSIPTSIIGTFILIYFMGFTLNIFTLLGLALAVGIVVDDAIMVLENIVRHSEMGKSRVLAAGDGAREITFAAVAASVAVMAIFLPIVFMKGIMGKFLYQFGVTITVAVALSLLEAITLTPMRCAQFLAPPETSGGMAAWSNRQFERLARGYRSILGFCLSHRWWVLISSTILFAASLFIINVLRKEVIPEQDMSVFMIRFETPVGSSLQFTTDKVVEAEKVLRSRPEVLRFFAAIGGFTGGEVNTGIFFISLQPKSERKASQREIMNWCRTEMSKIPKFVPRLADLASRGLTPRGANYPVEFNIRGGNYKVMSEKALEIMKRLDATGLVKDLNTDYREGMPEIRVIPDRARASASGVTMESIGQTVNAAIGGIREGKFSQGGRRYDVRLRLIPGQRVSPEDVEKLQIRNTYGEVVELRDVAKVEVVPTLQTITRQMRERSVTITANVASGKSQGDALNAAERISREVLPEGYRVFFAGSGQLLRESRLDFLFVFAMGVIVAYMVLASQFNSFLHPVTVLLALPFSISGALLALWIFGQTLNLYSGIGLILLMGIVKKNSILLVEFANKKREDEGLSAHDAMLAAGPIRLRPILMTSCATLAAALPPALAFGPGAETRIPMAITVIGGVLVSTVLTLFVVPSAYSLMSRMEGKRSHLPEKP